MSTKPSSRPTLVTTWWYSHIVFLAAIWGTQWPSRAIARVLQSSVKDFYRAQLQKQARMIHSRQEKQLSTNNHRPLSRPVGRLSFLKFIFSTFTLHWFEVDVGQKRQGLEICVWPINIELGHYSQCPTCHGFM